MTEEEIKICQIYGINPMYTDLEPYKIAYRLDQNLQKFRQLKDGDPEAAKHQADEFLSKVLRQE